MDLGLGRRAIGREDSAVETVAEVEIPGILGDHTWVYSGLRLAHCPGLIRLTVAFRLLQFTGYRCAVLAETVAETCGKLNPAYNKKNGDTFMRHLKALVGAALALIMAACSNPQFIIHPSSNPTATKTRQQLDALLDTTAIRPLRMGSFMFPNKGEFFRPLMPTDSRNAIVYVYRPQTDWNDQEVQSPGFFLDGQFLSGLKSGSYFWFEVPASQYYFNAKRPLAVIYLKTIFEAEFFFEGNKSYYFRYDEENPGPKKAVKGPPCSR
jgi:hypothetical protein